jgi:hypothetical protein
MRELLCEECTKRHLPAGTRRIQAASQYGPAEYQRLTLGTARKPQHGQTDIIVNTERLPGPTEHYLCDFCNKQIFPGDKCACWTVWTSETGPIGSWEQEYLERG